MTEAPIMPAVRQLHADLAWMALQDERPVRAVLARCDRAWDILMPEQKLNELIDTLQGAIQARDPGAMRLAATALAESDLILSWYLRWLCEPQPAATFERALLFQTWAGLTSLQDAACRASSTSERMQSCVIRLSRVLVRAVAALDLQPIISCLDQRVMQLARAVGCAFINQQETLP